MSDYQPLAWRDDRLVLLDQTRLPHEEVYLELTDYRDVIRAISSLQVRGAPAIGVAGAYAVVLGAWGIKAAGREDYLKEVSRIITEVGAARPTAGTAVPAR